MLNNQIVSEISNVDWDETKQPAITIITPVYNRRKTIERAINSVENQTFRDIEYIIIDDGSSEPIDDIVETYMKKTTLPVMFIKKQNGGVHTARNIGYKYARGTLIVNLDSDDEMLSDGCEVVWKEWESIPLDKRADCWQIKSRCKNQNGAVIGTPFPDNINEMPLEEAWIYFSRSKGDQSGWRVTKIMKENPFPEPDGVTFVAENIHWIPMERRYKSWGINKITDLIHTEGDDHLSKVRKKTLQTCQNSMWNAMYEVNHDKLYMLSFKSIVKRIFRYGIMEIIVRQQNPDFCKQNKILGFRNKILKVILWFPSLIGAFVYKKTRMK